MPTVPYSDDPPAPRPAPKPLPEPPPTDADTWADGIAAQRQQRLAEDARRRQTVIVRAGLDLPPERAARAIAVSERLLRSGKVSLRASILAEPGVLEDAEQQLAGGDFDFDRFRTESPAFAAWAARDPANAALAADDHIELAKVEALARRTANLRARPDGVFEVLDDDQAITFAFRDPYAFKARLRDERFAAEQAEEYGTAMREAYGDGLFYQFATGALGSATSTLGLLGAVDRDTAQIVGGISEAAAAWDTGLIAEVSRGAGGLAADAPLILLGGPLARAAKGLGTVTRAAAVRGLLATTPRAFMAGGQVMAAVGESTAGRLLGKAAITAAAVQPLALREAGDTYAQGHSLGDAATAWAIETFIPASFGATGVERLLVSGLSERAGKALIHSSRTLLREAGLEATEEVVTELAHAIHEDMAGINPDALDPRQLGRRLAVAGILGGGAGAAFNLPGFLAEQRRKDPATRALAAVQFGNNLETLATAAAASKTAGRVPGQVEQVLNQAAQGAEGYLDPEAWDSYWQTRQRDPRQMAQAVLGDTAAYDESRRAGTALRVKLGTFAAQLDAEARTHFAGEIRSEPDALNRREAMAEGERLLAEEVNDPEAKAASTAAEQRDAIAAGIEQQLLGAGSEASVAAAQARQMAAVFATTAKRLGIAPQQLFERYDLRINLVLPDILTAKDGIPDPVLTALRNGAPATGDIAPAVEELRAFVARHGIDLTADNTAVRAAIAAARRADQQAALRKRWSAEDDASKPMDKARQMGADAAAAQLRALAAGPDGQVIINVAVDRLHANAQPGGMRLGDIMRALGPDFGFVPDANVKLDAAQKARGDLFAAALRERGLTLLTLADAEGLLRIEESQAVAAAGEAWSPEQEAAVADALRLRDLAPAARAGRLTTEQEDEAIDLAERVGAALDILPLPHDAKAEVAAAVEDLRGVVLGQDTSLVGRPASDLATVVWPSSPWPAARLDGTKPGEAFAAFEREVVGKTLTLPTGQSITVRPVDFFRFCCQTPKDGQRKGFVAKAAGSAEALTMLREGKLAPEDIAGYQPDRAAQLLVIPDLISNPDAIVEQPSRYGERPELAIFKSYGDGAISLVVGWEPEPGRLGLKSFHRRDRRKLRTTPGTILWTKHAAPQDRPGDPGALSTGGEAGTNPAPSNGNSLPPDAAAGNQQPDVLGQPAYHGTGNSQPYDRFAYDKVGGPGGEGAQAYGWGLYFTGKKEVAAHYKEKLQESEVLVGGRLVADAVNDTPFSEVYYEIEGALREANGDVDAAVIIAEKAVETWKAESADKTKDWNITRWTKARDWLKTVERGSVKITSGRLYTVDIPEDSEMLDWDSETVMLDDAILAKLNTAIGEDMVDDSATVSELLKTAWDEYGKKETSDRLRAAGIPGITYMGEYKKTAGKGARNYVIFDDSKVAIKSYEQRKDSRRGQIAIGRKNAAGVRPMAITLFQRADLSTFLHESGHLYLELLGDAAEDAGAPQGVKDDYARLLAWLGVTDRRQITVEHHEKMARGFEAYLMEGKAPSREMAGIFARFKLWLTDLYRSVRALNVKLTDEVRGVFDRLLATDEEITDAVELLNARPLFTDAAQAGMTAEEFLAYRERADEAVASARSELEAQALAEIARERTAWWRERLAATRLEVESEVNRQPVYIAASVLKSGTYPAGVPLEPGRTAPKLSRLAVQAWLDAHAYEGQSRRVANGKLIGMHADDGLALDAAAALFGYPSGDALMQALVSRRARAELIDALANARMQERHGNMMLDGTMAEEARIQVNNAKRGELLVAEAKALGRKVGKKAAPSELLRQQAVARIGRMPVKDVRPDLYRQAQAKASRAAFQAVARGDHAAALIEKQRELLNYHLARAAQEARDGIEQDRTYLRRFLDPKRRQEIGKAGGWAWTVYRPDGTTATFASDAEASAAAAAVPGSIYERTSGYLNQIDALLERHDLDQGSRRATAARQSLRAWVEERRAEGHTIDLPEDVIDNTQRKIWRELTVDELGALRDAVGQIAHLAKVKNDLSALREKRNLEQTRVELVDAIARNVARRAERPSSPTGAQAAADWLDGAVAAHRKVSSLMREADGGQDGGIWWETFVRPLNEAADREVTMRREAAVAQEKLWTAWRDAGRNLDERATIGSLPPGRQTLTLNERLAVALNWGNLGNRERLLEGEGWDEAQALAVLDTLTEADWTLVQGIWDHIDTYWSDVKAKQERVEGVAPEKVAAAPVSTKFGQLRGGYYPVSYDPQRSAKAGSQEAATAATLYAIGQATRATTRRGHTKERSGGSGKPLRLDVGVVANHLAQVIHDLTHHETIISLNKLLRDDDIAQAMQDHLGNAALRQVSDTVAAVAVSDLAENGIDRTLRYLRNGVSIATMGFNVGTMAMQITGIGQSMQRVGALNFARGVARCFADPDRQEATVAWITGKSAFMANRMTTQVREVNEVLNSMRGGGWKTRMNALAYAGMQRTQFLVDLPTWYAGYAKALDEGRDEKAAVALADQAVIDAQGSGLTKDLAGVQRSQWTQMLSVFYSYFSTTFNLAANAWADAKRRTRAGQTPEAIGTLALDALQIFTIPALMATAVRAVMGKDDPDDDWITKLGKEHLSLAMGTIIGVRELSGALTEGYQYRGPAGFMGFSSLSNLIAQAKQGEADAGLAKATAQTVGIFFHIPTLQATRTIEGLLDWLEDRDDSSPRAILFGPPPQR